MNTIKSQKSSRRELREKRINDLLNNSRSEVLKQVLGPFGLTPAMFDDKDGGNVTTQHNAEQGVFAKESEEFNRADYDYSAAKRKKMRDAVQNGRMSSQNFVDQYTGNREPTKRVDSNGKLVMNAELDHLVPVKGIHGQGGWMKDKEGRTALSSEKGNLHYTTHKTNRRKSDKVPEKALSAEYGFDKDRIDPLLDKARESISKRLPGTSERLKYHGKEILSTGAQEAGRNALRQAFGMLMYELVNGSYIEVKRISNDPSLKENFVDHLIVGLKNLAVRIQEKLDKVFDTLISGGIQGFLSNLLTFLINNIVTTIAKVVTIIREGITGLWEAIKLVINPPDGMSNVEIARQVTKIIAGVITASLGIWFEESVKVFLTTSIPFFAPYSGAITAFITGIMTSIVIYAIERVFDWLESSGTEKIEAQILSLEATAQLLDSSAQMLEIQFNNSQSYQICIEQYQKIEANLILSACNLESALEHGNKSINIKKRIWELFSIDLPAIIKKDEELCILIENYQLEE